MSTFLKGEARRYHAMRERLLMAWPDLDHDTLTDTLEGITDLQEMIAGVIRSALVDDALQAGLHGRLEDMRQRLGRLEKRGTKKRQLALDAMTEVGLERLQQPDFTASARPGPPSLVIIAEEAIPSSYWIPQPPKIDRQTLLGELRQGCKIAGVRLSNPKPFLAVRKK
jgi:hypothetical protein